jgi:predicted negative regulator of RcsB-dependent stress response
MLVSSVLSSAAMAQDQVRLRTGFHDEYSRLVFEWPARPQYSVSKDGNRVLLRFGRAGSPNITAVDLSGNVKKIETISGAGEPLQMAVTIPSGSRFRDFIVENKLILDVYNSPTANKKSTPVVKAPAKTVENPVPKKEAQTAPQKTDFTLTPAESAQKAPVQKIDEAVPVKAPATPDHVITMTSTRAFGVSVFTRFGNLWIVIDLVEEAIKPVISGPKVENFGSFTEVPIKDGKAFYISLPEGLHPIANGGGLGWKIDLSSKPDERKPASLSRENNILTWKIGGGRKDLSITDPLAGDVIKVVTASHADQFAGALRKFVELEQLPSAAGLAYVPRVDDAVTEIGPSTISVKRPGGLALSSSSSSSAMGEPPAAEVKDVEDETSYNTNINEEDLPPIEDLNEVSQIKPPENRIYNFPRWEMGGIGALNNNMHLIMLDNGAKKDADRAESIITMAKLNLANNRAPEALGLLRIAEQFVPELSSNEEFLSLRGASSALAGKYDVAFSDLTNANLQKYSDVPYWRAFSLAGLADWKQAIEILPSEFEDVANYPMTIRVPLALSLAEIALRAGRVPQAENILSVIAPYKDRLPVQQKAALDYLYGEAERQKGNTARAEEYWLPLFEGKDHLYRAKAGLSLTRMQLDRKEIKPADAIHRLESLRYAWRGDELEALINFRLGQMYVENKDYLKGLTVLRNAEELATVRDLSNEIKAYMRQAFTGVFSPQNLSSMTPIEAIGVYEEFKDLAPSNEDGDRFVEILAERLVNADLLGRASALLEYQVSNRLKGDKKAEVAIRLAAIRLLDGNPDGALRSLEIAQGIVSGAEPAAGDAQKTEGADDKQPVTPLTTDSEKQRQINLLKARALSMKKKADEAIQILDKMKLDPDVNRLRTDIAWSAGKWEDASVALNDLIIAEQISPRLPLTDYQSSLVLNRAIALNLANDRVALANLRDRHNAQMAKTAKGQLFDVVTRPRRPDMVGSREAIESMMSEISLFQGFLDSYSIINSDKTPQGTAPKAEEEEKAPVAEPVPADDAANDNSAE